MLWPKASPLDLDFGLCAWAKLLKNYAVNNDKSVNGTAMDFTKQDLSCLQYNLSPIII